MRNHLLSDALDILYPTKCPVCERIISRKMVVCEECEDRVERVGENRCLRCGKTVYDYETEYCTDCRLRHHYFDGGMAVFEYDEDIKNAIYGLKYKNYRQNAKFFARFIDLDYGDYIRQLGIKLLIPVPMYEKKMRQRGYDQAALICKELSMLLDLEYCEALIRCKNTVALKELDIKERGFALDGAFALKEDISLADTVGVVDDIYTTGATMDACAKVLKDAGVLHIYSICACIGRGF